MWQRIWDLSKSLLEARNLPKARHGKNCPAARNKSNSLQRLISLQQCIGAGNLPILKKGNKGEKTNIVDDISGDKNS